MLFLATRCYDCQWFFQYIWFYFRRVKIDFDHVELILKCLLAFDYNWFCLCNWFWLYLKLELIAFDFIIDFYTNLKFNSFYMNVFIHSSLKINFNHCKVKHTRCQFFMFHSKYTPSILFQLLFLHKSRQIINSTTFDTII